MPDRARRQHSAGPRHVCRLRCRGRPESPLGRSQPGWSLSGRRGVLPQPGGDRAEPQRRAVRPCVSTPCWLTRHPAPDPGAGSRVPGSHARAGDTASALYSAHRGCVSKLEPSRPPRSWWSEYRLTFGGAQLQPASHKRRRSRPCWQSRLACTMLSRNAPLVYLQKQGGWRSASILLRVYARWVPEGLETVAAEQSSATQARPEALADTSLRVVGAR